MPVEARRAEIADDARVDASARITADEFVIGPGARIDAGVVLEGGRIVVGARAAIERDVVVRADAFTLGYKACLEHGSRFSAIGGPARLIEFGDYTFVGFRQNVLVPVLRVGDYTALHNSMLVNGYKPCTLGHNCWVGQETILNATEQLSIGNNVRIGTRSQLWTHVASGELLEGCLLFGSHALTIEDNVWIVGGAVISPNLVLRNGSVVMVGAVLTKSTEPRHCYAGVPAKDVSDKIPVYRDVSLQEKSSLMKGYVEEFHQATGGRHRELVRFFGDAASIPSGPDREQLFIVERGPVVAAGPRSSVFSLETKEYTKRRTDLEEAFIRFHLGYRARFLPANEGPRAT
jgi:acetyltransferase-like isoleucine patch superfamily enzyme